MSKEALKLALDALENHSGNYKLSEVECVKHEAVVEAIKEALAQPEQNLNCKSVQARLASSWGYVKEDNNTP